MFYYAGSKWVVPRSLLATSSLVDERLVSFFVSQSRSAEDEVLCRGVGPRIRGMQKRVPTNFFFLSPPQAVRKARTIMSNIVQEDILQQLKQLQQDAEAALAQANTTETGVWFGRVNQCSA